jgi:hypothetical protein
LRLTGAFLRDIDFAGEFSINKEDFVEAKKLWLDPEEVAPIIGSDRQSIYRDIRLGNFPFEFVRLGRRIKISARSLGLINDSSTSGAESAPQPQAASAAAQ